MTTDTQSIPAIVGDNVSIKKGKITVGRVMLYSFLIAFTLIYLMPFFGAIFTSVRTQEDISLNGFWSIPSEITFENYPAAWTQGRVSRYLLNSFIITIPALIGTIFLSSLSAFAPATIKGQLVIN